MKYIKYQTVFSDPYAFASEIKQATIEHYQLREGNFHGELIQIVSEPVIISTHQMNLPLLQSGTGVSGYTTFLIPGNMLEDFSWRKDRISGKRIGVLKGDMWHFAIAPPNFFGTPISISNSYLNDLIIKYGYDINIFKLIQQTEAIDLYPEEAFELQQMVIKLCNSKKPDIDLMTNDLPELLLKSIANTEEALPKHITNIRFRLFGEILAYIHQNLDIKITTSELSSAIDISERSLRNIFKEMIGLSPMRYIKTIRLNMVRKEIKISKGEREISTIANKWGFSHSGQFAKDYKTLFGEFPSKTDNSAIIGSIE